MDIINLDWDSAVAKETAYSFNMSKRSVYVLIDPNKNIISKHWFAFSQMQVEIEQALAAYGY